jgi:GNAT superfamily N-acetyltransferase
VSSSTIDIRAMGVQDVDFGMELKNLAGWNQLPDDWRRMIELTPDGCFVAMSEGTPVGTATTINYEGKSGWVAMVLVHPEYRRKGIGSALLYACIDHLEQHVETVKLDATPMGKQLYDTLGFVDEYMMERWLGRGIKSTEVAGVRPITSDMLSAVCQFDMPVFGADRSRLLRAMVTETANTSLCVVDHGQLVGYSIVRPGYHAWQIGPMVATEPDVAKRLYQAMLGVVGEEAHVYNDALLPNPHVLDLLRDFGFDKQRHLIRMYKGPNTHPGLPQYVYAASGPEKG